MISMDFLKKGDTIGVAAPSARFDRTLFEKGCQVLEAAGFTLRVPEAIFEKKRYLAGDDLCRARVIHSLIRDPDVKGILAVRGGFGAMRILEHLDWDLIRKHPKLFMGFSDATALLNTVVTRAGFPVVHGPNLVSLARADARTLAVFFKTLARPVPEMAVPNGVCLVPGRAGGRLAGGNLATLAHLTGTRFEPDFTDTILFLEDVGEPAYKIDRMLSQMKLAGLFKQVRGVVTGSFERCHNPEYIPGILQEIFGQALPLLMGLDAGHGQPNLSLVLGWHVILDAHGKQLHWQEKG
jgi:muramoyltetrapeptide carboxypeptidase